MRTVPGFGHLESLIKKPRGNSYRPWQEGETQQTLEVLIEISAQKGRLLGIPNPYKLAVEEYKNSLKHTAGLT